MPVFSFSASFLPPLHTKISRSIWICQFTGQHTQQIISGVHSFKKNKKSNASSMPFVQTNVTANSLMHLFTNSQIIQLTNSLAHTPMGKASADDKPVHPSSSLAVQESLCHTRENGSWWNHLRGFLGKLEYFYLLAWEVGLYIFLG